MKRLSIILSLFAAIVCSIGSAYGQSSTVGREFWVALNITTGTGGTDHKPFIYITTQQQGGSYTITNPADASFTPITGLIPPTGYVKITIPGDITGTANLDLNRWYPVGLTAPAASNQIKNVGLKIETTVDCSVFAANSLPQSFDAANILPITALQMDYLTQDYPGYDHGGSGTNDGGFPVMTILATDNNTHVTINPSTNVLNNNGTATITKTLNAGQVLYLTGENRASLSGSTVTSDKKIAVFTGVNNTDVPGDVSARDHLYEQNMPTDYWGREFVVTRSMKKDANRIRVTAKENDTEITVDGATLATINAGETYEFELCEAAMRTQSAYTRAVAIGRGTDFYLDGEAHYLKTSCPCAVFSYDVSENYYISNGTSERDPNAHGDPAMVWISPIEQRLREIIFGVMNTDFTTTHFVNIITPTTGAGSLEVREVAMSAGKVIYGNNLVTAGDVKPVPSKPEYSYARIKLTENKESVYIITSNIGFIAHVYGSGDKESYAYSCGSAAVKRGVRINNRIFETSVIPDTIPFCMNDLLEFNAKISGSEDIDGVDWDFGDGVTLSGGEEVVETNHTYTSPGWYDVSARLLGKPACSNIPSSDLGTVSFSFYVNRPDTLEFTDCACESELPYDFYGQKFWRDTTNAVVADDKCGTVYKLNLTIAKEVTNDLTNQPLFGRDEYVFHGPNGDTTFTETCERYVVKYPSPVCSKCDSTVIYKIQIIHCLSIEIERYAQTECPGKTISIGYIKHKGNIAGATLQIGGQEIALNYNNSIVGQTAYFTADLERITPGTYNNAKIVIVDESSECQQVVPLPPFTVEVSVLYPSNVFARKYYNVLAVLNSAYNGGYTFSGYQWYVRNTNDPTSVAHPIEGANEIIYHTDNLGMGYAYSVYLLNGGTWTMSCERVITDMNADSEPTPHAPEVRKMVKDQQLFIEVDGVMYDSMGNRVE